MKFCGVLCTSLLVCCVAVESVNPLVLVARQSISRIKRQATGGDPNLEAVFGQQGGNSNFGNGQFSSGGNERPPFGFGFSGMNEGSSNNNGGFGGFNNNAGSSNNNNNQNQGSSTDGDFNNFGAGGFDNQGSNGGGFNNFGSTQGSNGGGFNNLAGTQGSSFGSGNNGGLSNTQGSSFANAQNIQRPQTTQRTPLNLISMQNTIDNTECARLCRTRATQQYNPVCGSDNISYANRQTFDCYQRECRRDVSVVYAGSCVTTRVPSTTTPNYYS